MAALQRSISFTASIHPTWNRPGHAPFDPPHDVQHVVLIEDDADPFWRAILQLDELLAEPPEGAARH
jgi:hypothetical protein